MISFKWLSSDNVGALLRRYVESKLSKADNHCNCEGDMNPMSTILRNVLVSLWLACPLSPALRPNRPRRSTDLRTGLLARWESLVWLGFSAECGSGRMTYFLPRARHYASVSTNCCR
jgi:hypothetical protein